jgi:hypothetical protein
VRNFTPPEVEGALAIYKTTKSETETENKAFRRLERKGRVSSKAERKTKSRPTKITTGKT